MTAAIETEKLTKYYGHSRGIMDVDLTVEAGQIFGFLGPNGAGKSTTIRLLLDLIRPTSGSARVLGMDVHRDRLASDVACLVSETRHKPLLIRCCHRQQFPRKRAANMPRAIGYKPFVKI